MKSLLASWRLGLSFTAALVLGTFLVSLHGADHGDVPSSLGDTRFDASITDLYAFQSGPNLVLVVSTNPAIYDTARPAAYPNGRALTDDVVDLVGDPRVLETDGPLFPTENDMSFLPNFPYLAPPHVAQ